MTDTDPKNEVGNKKAPHHRTVKTGNTETLVYHEPSGSHGDKHAYRANADRTKEPLGRVQNTDQEFPVYLSSL